MFFFFLFFLLSLSPVSSKKYILQINIQLLDAGYFGSRFLLYKRFALCNFFKIRDPNDMGPYDILNRIINGIVVSIGTLGVMDYLSIQMGHAIRGLLTLGSLGTVAFTLASKDFLTALISGFVLILGKRLRVGDSVVFGDGTSGKVIKVRLH